MTKQDKIEKEINELFNQPRGFWGWYYDLYFIVLHNALTFLEKIGLYKQE